MGFRPRGSKQVPQSAREVFLQAVRSGSSWAAAATLAGVSHPTGSRWARAAGIAADSRHHGIRYSAAVRGMFWVAMQAGASMPEAAVSSGVSEQAARRWVHQAGYVARTAPPADQPLSDECRPRAPLTFTERFRLEELLEAGCEPRQAAEVLARHRDTIGREIVKGMTASGYRARVGQNVAEANRQRPKARKLLANPVLLDEVVARLKQRHSPEQIAGRLRQDFPDDPEMWVSHETIYRSLFVQARGALKKELIGHLRTKRRFRRSRHATYRGQGRGTIIDAVSIRDRPAEVEDRAVPGHWEGDLVEGSRGTYIATLVERQSRFVMLVKLSEKRTDAVVDALIKAVRKLPVALRKSLTWDRGAELASHAVFTVATDVKVYFCDPSSPWQRGSNENMNGLLRQYYPKGADLSEVTQAQLDLVAKKLNTRPRATLHWKTPACILGSSVSLTH